MVGMLHLLLESSDDNIDYHLQLAGALTFLTNISDEKQYFTYDWGRTLGIAGSGDSEPGAAFRVKVQRHPKDLSTMRIELGGSVGYQSNQVIGSALLSFVFPID